MLKKSVYLEGQYCLSKHCDNEGDDDCNDYKHCKNVEDVEYLVGQ